MTDHIQILMATQTGGAEDVANQIRETLKEKDLSASWHDLAEIDQVSFLKEASLIIGVVSTWGDGEPPDDAVPFFEELRAHASLDLPETPMAIIGLGDSGYDIFCGCGIELEKELIRHGGKPLLPRADFDVWYDDELKQWLQNLKNLLPAEVRSLVTNS